MSSDFKHCFGFIVGEYFELGIIEILMFWTLKNINIENFLLRSSKHHSVAMALAKER